MATVTKSIGATGRDYSTITAWEADLDNDTPYDAGDAAVGECYDDSDFDMQGDFTLNGGCTLGLDSVRLSVAAGERHDGSAGTGVRVYTSTTTAYRFYLVAISEDTAPYALTMEWLELDGSDEGVANELINSNSQTAGNSAVPLVRNCIIHNAEKRWLNSTSYDTRLQNNIFYACGTSGAGTIGIYIRGYKNNSGMYNCTLHGLISTTSSGSAYARALQWIYNYGQTRLHSNLITGTDLPNSSSTAVYDYYSTREPFSNTTRYSRNASEDETTITLMLEGTAGSAACVTGVVPANVYVSTTLGSEDLRIKDNSEGIIGGAIDAGTSWDLNIDIEGFDRDDADAWDIGADQFVADDTVGASFAMFVD